MYEDEMQAELHKRRRKKNGLGRFLVFLQAVLTVVFLGLVFVLDMFPLRYVAALGGVLGILWVISLMTQCFQSGRGVGKVFALLTCDGSRIFVGDQSNAVGFNRRRDFWDYSD